jgi:hypothetical protein
MTYYKGEQISMLHEQVHIAAKNAITKYINGNLTMAEELLKEIENASEQVL